MGNKKYCLPIIKSKITAVDRSKQLNQLVATGNFSNALVLNLSSLISELVSEPDKDILHQIVQQTEDTIGVLAKSGASTNRSLEDIHPFLTLITALDDFWCHYPRFQTRFQR